MFSHGIIHSKIILLYFHRSFEYILWRPLLCFYGISMYAMCLYIYVFLALFLCLFFFCLFILSYSELFAFVLSYYYSLDGCLFSKRDRKTVDLDVRGGVEDLRDIWGGKTVIRIDYMEKGLSPMKETEKIVVWEGNNAYQVFNTHPYFLPFLSPLLLFFTTSCPPIFTLLFWNRFALSALAGLEL